MGKSYKPSGTQRITLNLAPSTDRTPYVLPQNTEDEKLLYSLCKSGKLYDKILILTLLNVCETSGNRIIAVPMVEDTISEIEFVFASTGAEKYHVSLFAYSKENDEITITVVEQ